jgi:hypothetical protein
MKDKNVEYGESKANYLLTGGEAILTFLESLWACVSILFLVSDIYLNPHGYDWGPWFTNYTVSLLYFSLSLVGFAISLYVLSKFNRDLEMQKSIRLSVSKMTLILNPPFFFVALIVGTSISVIQPNLTLFRGVLLCYGFGLGLLLARVLYYIYESRTWIVTPIFPAKAIQKRKRVLGFMISSQTSSAT